MGGTNQEMAPKSEPPKVGSLKQQGLGEFASGGSWNIQSSHPEQIMQGVAAGLVGPLASQKDKGQRNEWSDMVKQWLSKAQDKPDSFQSQYGNDTSPEDKM